MKRRSSIWNPEPHDLSYSERETGQETRYWVPGFSTPERPELGCGEGIGELPVPTARS